LKQDEELPLPEFWMLDIASVWYSGEACGGAPTLVC